MHKLQEKEGASHAHCYELRRYVERRSQVSLFISLTAPIALFFTIMSDNNNGNGPSAVAILGVIFGFLALCGFSRGFELWWIWMWPEGRVSRLVHPLPAARPFSEGSAELGLLKGIAASVAARPDAELQVQALLEVMKQSLASIEKSVDVKARDGFAFSSTTVLHIIDDQLAAIRKRQRPTQD
jgi:hypothetical protein